MKRIAILTVAMAFAFAAQAQGPADALRFSLLSYEGTARTMAMGNAFTALGGDIGGIAVNPAASGVMRHSEVSISPGGIFSSCGYDYLGAGTREHSGRFVLNNLGITFAFDSNRLTGLRNFNFSLAANRIADFNSVSGFSGTTDQSTYLGAMASDLYGTPPEILAVTDYYNPYFDSSVPWASILAYDCYLVSLKDDALCYDYIGATENGWPYRHPGGRLRQDYFSRSTGGIMQYTMNFGFNISDMVFLGFNLNLHSLNYTLDETYSEEAPNPELFDEGFRSMSSSYRQTTTGAGFNAKFGIIATPVAGLRLGATITTPTVYKLRDRWGRSMNSSFTGRGQYNWYSPDGECSYRFVAPMQWSFGLAYTFGSFALLSADYEGVNYAAATFSNMGGNSSEFRNVNRFINKGLRSSNIFRAGAEIRPMEFLSLRLGYNRHSSAGALLNDSGLTSFEYPVLNYLSCGAGIRFADDLRCSLDLAYQKLLNANDYFTMYPDYTDITDGNDFYAPVADGWRSTGKLTLTFTFKF